MDNKLKEIETADELVQYLAEHGGMPEPYDEDSKKYIMKMVSRFGLSKNVLRTHYDIQKK